MGHKVPDTSHSAYNIAKKGMINNHHQKIIAALQVLGSANYEKIAKYLTMDKHQIGRRLSELQRLEVVYKPGSKSTTVNGRMSYNYSLLTTGAKTDNEVKEAAYKPEIKISTDYAKELIAPTLFNPATQ